MTYHCTNADLVPDRKRYERVTQSTSVQFSKGYEKAPSFQLNQSSAVQHAFGPDCAKREMESCRKAVICKADIAMRWLSVILSCYILSQSDKRSTRGICRHRKYTRIIRNYLYGLADK